jgi:hypothetical protein
MYCVMDAPLLIERGNRLRANILAATSVYGAIGHARVHGAQHPLNKVAPVIDFSHD